MAIAWVRTAVSTEVNENRSGETERMSIDRDLKRIRGSRNTIGERDVRISCVGIIVSLVELNNHAWR